MARVPWCVVCLAGVLIPSPVVGAFENDAMGPRAVSMGASLVAAGGDPWTPFFNPAGIASCSSFGIACFHVPGLYGITELGTSGVCCHLPIPQGGVFASGSWFGSGRYREHSFGFGAGRSVARALALGLRMGIRILAIDGYGSCTSVTLDAGVRVECSDNLAIGGEITNITSSTLGRTRERLPQVLSGGLWYSPVPLLHIGCAVSKELLFPAEFQLGVEILPVDALTLRGGIIDNPSYVTGGIAVRLAGMSCEYGMRYHWILGATHAIGLTLSLP